MKYNLQVAVSIMKREWNKKHKKWVHLLSWLVRDGNPTSVYTVCSKTLKYFWTDIEIHTAEKK